MAADLVQMNVDVIVTPSTSLASLARKATPTTPIVAAVAGELEGTGLIASLRRPGVGAIRSDMHRIPDAESPGKARSSAGA